MMEAPSSRKRDPQVALVTGAARRIGRAIALALARKGYHVALHYRTAVDDAALLAADIEALGSRAAPVDCDLEDADAVRMLVPRAAAALGPICCVVNSASPFVFDDATGFSPALLQQAMQINVAAPVLLARALAAQLPPSCQGVVINLLDQKLWNPNPDYFSYTLSKAALKEATTLLAQALAPRVRVVGVAPGLTLASGDQTDEEFTRAHSRTPLGRSSDPDDIAAAVVFLAQAQAITGTTLLVDGGQHLVPSERDVMFVARNA